MDFDLSAQAVKKFDLSGLQPVVRYGSRQAILDARGRLYGYDLIFQDETEVTFNRHRANQTNASLDEAIVSGLERFTGGLAAFISCTEKTITEQLIELMPPNITVLNFRVLAEPSNKFISSLQFLKVAGFRIALSGFWWDLQFERVVELADFLRVDYAPMSASRRLFLREFTRRSNATLMACNVETHDDLYKARNGGFKLFHGPYICRPVVLKNRTIKGNRLAQVQIIEYMHAPDANMFELSKLVARDVSISYRLLRLVNSPLFALPEEVRSIEAALLLVGQDAFQRIVMLAVASELNSGGSDFVLLLALVRARFCEQGARLCGFPPAEQYMLGMFSLLPVMLRVEMGDITSSLPLRKEILDALNSVDNVERTLLGWLEDYERGAWEQCDQRASANELNGSRLAELYTEAVYWAEKVFQTSKSEV